MFKQIVNYPLVLSAMMKQALLDYFELYVACDKNGKKSKVQAWFVVRRIDSVEIYMVYKQIDIYNIVSDSWLLFLKSWVPSPHQWKK